MAKYFYFELEEMRDPDDLDSTPYSEHHLFHTFADAFQFASHQWFSDPPYYRNYSKFHIYFVQSDSEFFYDYHDAYVPDDAYCELIIDFVRVSELDPTCKF